MPNEGIIIKGMRVYVKNIEGFLDEVNFSLSKEENERLQNIKKKKKKKKEKSLSDELEKCNGENNTGIV